MPFETATTSVFGLDASSPKRSKSNVSEAVVKSAERHATKWMRASAMAHLGLAIRSDHQTKMPKSEHKSGSTDSRPYWMQGDESLNTKAAWAQRMKLRAHPAVLAKLQMWWECMIASVQSVDPERTTIDKASYVRVSRLLHKAIIEEWDEADATQCAEEDWKNDAGGRTSIDQGRFLDCVFELADIWTRTIEADEYASFLQRLLDDVATTGGDGQRYFWREERDTKYGGYIMVDDDEDAEADAAAAAAAAATAAAAAAAAAADSDGGNGAGKDGGAGAGAGEVTGGPHGGKGGDDGHGIKGVKSPRGKGKKAKVGGEVGGHGSHGSHGGKHDNAHAGGSGGHGGAGEHVGASSMGGRREHHDGHHNRHHERDEKEKHAKEAHGKEEHAKDGREEWRSGQGKEHYVTGLGVGSEAAQEEEWKIGEHWKVAGHGGLEERKPGMDWGDKEEAPKGTQLPPIARARAAGGANDSKNVSQSLPSLPAESNSVPKISKAQRREVREGRVISAYGDPGPKPTARVSVAAAGLALKQDIDFLLKAVAAERSPGARDRKSVV
jgi:hypothetical protein